MHDFSSLNLYSSSDIAFFAIVVLVSSFSSLISNVLRYLSEHLQIKFVASLNS